MTRLKWIAPKRTRLIEELRKCDQESFETRLGRLIELYEEFGPPCDMLLLGGLEAMFAIHEMQNSYVNANFMAVVLLAQAFVEHSVAGSYVIAGDDATAESGFAKILKAALADGSIDEWLYDKLDALRKIRNPYVHMKVGLKTGSFMKRMADSCSEGPFALAEQDARFAIQTVVDFIRNQSPDWGPGNVPQMSNDEK